MKTQDLIQEFFAQKRFAFVGVSRKNGDFSRTLLNEFLKRNYDVVPVNPHTNEIEGRQCFPTVGEITPPVTAALLLAPKYATDAVVRQCAEAGIKLLWVYGISGPKDLPAGVEADCERHGIRLVPGYCPFMFMEHVTWFHRWHGKFMKFVGEYPS
jgi:predicted CoA-binding protein